MLEKILNEWKLIYNGHRPDPGIRIINTHCYFMLTKLYFTIYQSIGSSVWITLDNDERKASELILEDGIRTLWCFKPKMLAAWVWHQWQVAAGQMSAPLTFSLAAVPWGEAMAGTTRTPCHGGPSRARNHHHAELGPPRRWAAGANRQQRGLDVIHIRCPLQVQEPLERN